MHKKLVIIKFKLKDILRRHIKLIILILKLTSRIIIKSNTIIIRQYIYLTITKGHIGILKPL